MINIAKLLKDAPKGLKLYSPLFGEVVFSKINSVNAVEVIVTCTDGTQCIERFHSNGTYISRCPDAECLLFPSKEVRTWENFKLLAKPNFKVGDWLYHNTCGIHPILVRDYSERQGYKVECLGLTYYLQQSIIENGYHLWSIEDANDGDILVTTKVRSCPFIYRKTSYNNNLAYYYVGIDGNGDFCEGCLKRTLFHFGSVENVVPATKEQRDLLFNKMKEAGYEWNADKKELRKIKSRYNVKNFHVGMPVLVRADNDCTWDYSLFSRNTYSEYWHFAVCNGVCFTQCIPFNKDTKHLLGTTDMCPEEYINW